MGHITKRGAFINNTYVGRAADGLKENFLGPHLAHKPKMKRLKKSVKKKRYEKIQNVLTVIQMDFLGVAIVQKKG